MAAAVILNLDIQGKYSLGNTSVVKGGTRGPWPPVDRRVKKKGQ